MNTKPNITWESVVWIIVWVFILSIVILWIWQLISYSNNLTNQYNDAITLRLLQRNVSNTIKKIDTTNILENEVFYLYKDEINKEYVVFTWSTNEQYKYINSKWGNITDIINYNDDIYSQILLLQREDTALWSQNQVVKVSIQKLIKN